MTEVLSAEQAKKAVLAVHPDAHCWIVLCAPTVWEVQPMMGYGSDPIGEGPTDYAAWIDAASRLEVVEPLSTQEVQETMTTKQKQECATELLYRFVEVYGEVPLEGAMIEPGMKLWRDFYEFSGEHMILSDEGWEPGDVKQDYIDEYGPDAILDEVNAPEVVKSEAVHE